MRRIVLVRLYLLIKIQISDPNGQYYEENGTCHICMKTIYRKRSCEEANQRAAAEDCLDADSNILDPSCYRKEIVKGLRVQV